MEVLVYLIVGAVIVYLLLNRKKNIPDYGTTYKVKNSSNSEYSSDNDLELEINTFNSSQSDYLDN